MRLLHIHSGNMYGGIERMLVSLASHRRECNDMEPEFALCFDGRLASELRLTGVVVHMLPEVRLRNPVGLRRARHELSNVIKHRRIDIALVHSCWAHAAFGSVVKRNTVGLVHYQHGITNGRHWLELIARRCPPDRLLANSGLTVSLSAQLFPGKTAEVVHPPVELLEPWNDDARRTARHAMGVRDDTTVIVHVSRLEPWKGLTLFLEALSLMTAMPNWVAWHAGAPHNRSERHFLHEVTQLQERLGLVGRVIFLGLQRRISDVLGPADLFCQTNTAPEPFGVGLLEAVTSGLTCVVGSPGGADEVLGSDAVRRARSNTPQDLAEALSAAIVDTKRRTTMRQYLATHSDTLRRLADPTPLAVAINRPAE